MKKKAPVHRGDVKRTGTPATIDEYLAGVPEPARTALRNVRVIIRSAAPENAVETVSYGMPAFKYKGMLMWFAAFSGHCSLFPASSIVALFKDDLKSFSTSKGTIHFPLDKPLPAGLIRRMVNPHFSRAFYCGGGPGLR